MSSQHFTRRNFIKTGAVTGVGASFSTKSYAQLKNHPQTDLLKIGIIFGGGNHAQNMWARLINAVLYTNNIPYTPRRTGMVFTHVWAVIPEWAERFARTYGVKNVVRRFDDMVGKVDGIFIDAFFGTPYYHHLAKPYIESKTPIFVNRPFSDAVRKA